jgi:hypothetical protein
MEKFLGVEVQFSAFLNSKLYGVEWSASRSASFIPRKRASNADYVRGWMSSIADLNIMEKRNVATAGIRMYCILHKGMFICVRALREGKYGNVTTEENTDNIEALGNMSVSVLFQSVSFFRKIRYIAKSPQRSRCYSPHTPPSCAAQWPRRKHRTIYTCGSWHAMQPFGHYINLRYTLHATTAIFSLMRSSVTKTKTSHYIYVWQLTCNAAFRSLH